MKNQSQKTSKERIKEGQELVNQYPSIEGKKYILKVLVNQKELTKGEAGLLTLNNNL